MNTISKEYKSTFSDKGSKFEGYLFSTSDQESFQQKLDKIKNEYPKATHHCYAYRLNPNDILEVAQDDGEPSGTAGLPILNQLKSFGVVNCGCIIVRYYGGTNLGKSGLIQAYGQTAERCLQQCRLQKIVATQNFRVSYPYSQQAEIDRLTSSFNLKEIDANYLETVTITFGCRLEQADHFKTALDSLEHKNIESEILGKSHLTITS